ncbi:lipid-A-disaccharide synthase [Hyphococcus luteus]|uniref:Lipid-A-disaccharide synthase n=1 Tax=Hyphococcus luteus TaxID=2058213 RepID=A0A2S7JYQ5_9PROT|nr:lipid-A-disaccharide synthase [Marinicaulis flavus]PQA85381.1 lipid-A-disaccharide synthase [Marinicaulis flavus]
MSASPLKILLCALEPSADALGADLMAALRKRCPEAAFIGCGGALMAAQGLESLFPVDRFSVIGPVAALQALPAALKAADRLADLAEKEKPQTAILIDSWSFSKIAAMRLRKRAPEMRLIKYVAPQVWASRPRRAQKTAELFDGVLCLFGFETGYFEQAGANTRWVGHPGFQAILAHDSDKAAFRARHNIGAGPLLAVLPGSRAAELKRHAAPFRGAIEKLLTDFPDLRVVVSAAPGAENAVRALAAGWPGGAFVVEGEERFEACRAADAALAASGTATAELALLGTPMVVAYKVELLTELWARAVLTTPHVSLVNIAAGREVAPELLQRDCRPERLAAALAPLMRDGPARRSQIEAFPAIARLLAGERSPGDAAAAAVLDWLGTGKTP